MRDWIKGIGCAAAVAAALIVVQAATAAEPDDGLVFKALGAMKGKKVGYVPIGIYDLTSAWGSGLKLDAERYGYQLLLRDPNWSVEAGAQAISELINEKPDVLVIHPPEIPAYTRFVQRANAAGIPVVQINLKSQANGDVVIGPDWYEMGVKQTLAAVKMCGKDSGKSGKIAVMEGVLTNPTSTYGIQAIHDVLKEHPDVELVSTQAADWDASKAHAVAATVLKAHPDLCAYIGMWDNMDSGIVAAIKEAGLTGKVSVISSGGGAQSWACDNVANGNFAIYFSYDAKEQGRDLMMAVRSLLQVKPEKPGAQTVSLITPLEEITKETLHPGSCWDQKDVEKYGP